MALRPPTPAALLEAHAPGVATTPAERTSKEAAKKLWQAMQTDGWDALNIESGGSNRLIQWMLGFTLAIVVAIAWRVFE